MTLNIKTLDRICLVTVVVIFLVCGYWVVSGGIRQVREIRQEKNLLSNTLKNLALAETSLQQLDAAIAETRKQMKALNARIPDSAKVGEFLKQLDALMKERKVVLESFQSLPVVKEKLFTRIPIRLTCRGSFANIYHLLHDLETMNRLADVEKITITNPDSSPACRLEMTTRIFQR
jgi:Tfp pilus assembly protein PilO